MSWYTRESSLDPSVSAFLIIRTSGCSSVQQFVNSFQKDDNKMISLMTSALVLLLVGYNHFVLDQCGDTTWLCSGALVFDIHLRHG